MQYIIYDCQEPNSNQLFLKYAKDDVVVINAAEPIAKCTGCFKCWLKNPSVCAFNDKMQGIGTKLLNSDEIIIVCKGVYGGFSVNVKRIIDRVIPAVLPFFTKENNELHHKQRYNNQPKIKVIFYNGNEMLADERRQAENLLSAVALNFHAKEHKVIFAQSLQNALVEVEK